ncbi:MAG: DEAD/DEAH box helicase family protein [bacterium]|nr:DEAD/DEAH box helicase family protein [bacterium]
MIVETQEKRKLELRAYQAEPFEYIMEHDKTVLAMAPNGGKTEVSIYAISEYLKQNPGARVLVLTHSTNVLLDNFVNRLDNLQVDFTYSTEFDPESQVHISLPNSEHKIQEQYDFLVVDEAHENYLADRVQRIIRKINPTKQLLLTGTPENFIREGGYDIYFLALNDIPKEYFAKLSIELVASKYDWESHYNQEEHIDSSFSFNEQDTRDTLEAVVLKLVERLKKGYTAEQFNVPNLLHKFKSWAFVYEEIGKTVIYTKRIEQANQIYSILDNKKVSVAISHSETDNESEEIENFRGGDYDVLIVVNRAKLGYSDNDLFNIIDMSGTHNPSLIYQMLCRCVRGDSTQQKHYLKVTPQGRGRMDLTHTAVCAALMLSDKTFLSTYNGRNFSGILIPVIQNPPRQREGPDGGDGEPRRRNQDRVVFPEYTNDVIDMFKHIVHDLSNPTSIYKATTIGKVRHILGFKRAPNGFWTKEECQKEASKYDTRGEFEKGNTTAYQMASREGWMNDICGHMEKPRRVSKARTRTRTRAWTKEECRKEAMKYDTRGKFDKGSGGAYGAARRNGWLDDICGHMALKWTKERCQEEALDYDMRGKFQKGSGSAYQTAHRNGWLDDICGHMKEVVRVRWTKERCQEEALDYDTRNEFQKGSVGAYGAAWKNGWLDDICGHMVKNKK